MYHSSSEFPSEKCLEEEEENFEHKSALRMVVMEGMSMVSIFLHISSTSGTKILLPFSPYASLLVPTMWNFSCEKNISGCDCVLPHVYGQDSL